MGVLGGFLFSDLPQGPQEQGWQSSTEQSIHPSSTAGEQDSRGPGLPTRPPPSSGGSKGCCAADSAGLGLQGWDGWWLWPGGQVWWGEMG